MRPTLAQVLRQRRRPGFLSRSILGQSLPVFQCFHFLRLTPRGRPPAGSTRPIHSGLWRVKSEPFDHVTPTRLDSHGLVILAIVGNLTQTVCKLVVWHLSGGSSGLLATAIHSFVDTLNQALLLKGQKALNRPPNRAFQYGYGREAFFWALVSGVGLFWCGGIFSILHGLSSLDDEPTQPKMLYLSWLVLGLSLLLDGFVLFQSLKTLRRSCPPGVSLWTHWSKLKDPFQRAVLLEDSVAVGGVAIAAAGLTLSYALESPIPDALAAVSIGCLLVGASVSLIKHNRKYLVGGSLPPEMAESVLGVIRGTDGVRAAFDFQTTWIGIDSFQAWVWRVTLVFFLVHRQPFCFSHQLVDELLTVFVEDVLRVQEEVVARVTERVREAHPGAAYIEITPASKALHLKLRSRRELLAQLGLTPEAIEMSVGPESTAGVSSRPPGKLPGVEASPVVMAAGKGDMEAMRTALGELDPAQLAGELGTAAVAAAAGGGHLAIVDALVSAGALAGSPVAAEEDVNTRDSGGVCGMTSALAEDAASAWPRRVGPSPLAAAVAADEPSIEMVKLLLLAGADPNAPDSDGRLPLQLAARAGLSDIVHVLLQGGADISRPGAFGMTALHDACEAGHAETAEVLLLAGAAVDAADYKQRTALHRAAELGRDDIVRVLVSAGAYVEACDRKDFRPLHVAAAAGYEGVVAELIKGGADVSARNRDGDTAAALAALREKDAVTTLLQNAARPAEDADCSPRRRRRRHGYR